MSNIEKIVKTGLCIGCGICTYSDVIDRMVYSETMSQFIPEISNKNKNDSKGFKICPGKGYNIIEDGNKLFGKSKYDLELGHVYNSYAACSKDKKILENASSGGIMSQIAIYLLDNKIVDRVLTTHFIYLKGPRAIGILAKNKDEVLQSQGSKYCPVDISDALKEIKDNNFKVAIIGTPCQIAGIRSIQKIDTLFAKNIILTIANFCGGFKSYENISLISKRKGIDPDSISYFRFRGSGQPGSLMIKDRSGKTAEHAYPKYVGLNGLSKHLRCSLCVDATGELADISCGDAWLNRFLNNSNPWSVLLTRNKYSDELIQNLINSNLIITQAISSEEIKLSQRQNLLSKKVRQNSRYHLYKLLGYELPKFDGGFYINKVHLIREIKIYTKHYLKNRLEKIGLFYLIYKLIEKIKFK